MGFSSRCVESVGDLTECGQGETDVELKWVAVVVVILNIVVHGEASTTHHHLLKS